MTLVVASGELAGGNVLSFGLFPTQPHALHFSITFHVEGDGSGEIAYRVRKWEDVILQTAPIAFSPPHMEGQKLLTHADRIDVVFPSQGSYLLDVFFDGALVHTLPFSVFDSSQRASLEREIIYYLKAKRGARSVQEITRGVFNPAILNKANRGEVAARVYFALLRMKEVTNTSPIAHGSLQDNMNSSRWKLKE